ncbi:hypothetical protein GGR52DRAFT_576968 [Hypoxylon sp. FL1284]|nr:hypothetical protein GGR52DRAFT_576968 [Hypoxylon sp. FL1284]
MAGYHDGLPAVLVWITFALASATNVLGAATEFAPCDAKGEWVVKDFYSETHDEIETFSFNLTTTTNNYTTPCYGTKEASAQESYTTACDIPPPGDPRLNTTFNWRNNNYLDLNQVWLCDRGDDATSEVDRIAATRTLMSNCLLSLDLVDGSRTGTYKVLKQKAEQRWEAYSFPSIHKPTEKCLWDSASLASGDILAKSMSWELTGIFYAASFYPPDPITGNGGGGPQAHINFYVLNSVDDYQVYCLASGGTQNRDDPGGDLPLDGVIIDTDKTFSCPYEGQGMDSTKILFPEDYPRTSYTYDTATKTIELEQEWDCSGDDGKTHTYVAKGSAKVPLKCSFSDPGSEPTYVCPQVSITIPASSVEEK